MNKLTYTVGLPASGKTTWAREQVAADTKNWTIRVNKDDLRGMLFDGKWTRDREKEVLVARDTIIRTALSLGKSVIVDDTNFEPKHAERFYEFAKAYGIELVRQDFTDVPLNVCLERNKSRERVIAGRDVPPEVIHKMWMRYIKPMRKPLVEHPSLPACVICDLDGTIAINNGHRGWYDNDKVFGDDVRWPVLQAVIALCDNNAQCALIFMSGRKTYAYDETVRWLSEKCGMQPGEYQLLMRLALDDREDSIVKRELYEKHIAGKYRVVGVFDDRKQVIRMWESLGLTVFNVGDVDVEF